MQPAGLADHAVIERKLRLPDVCSTLTPSAFGFHGVHNLLCVLSPEELADFMANAPDSAFAGFRMRRFIKHALRQREIELAHRALRRRRSSRKLDLSEARLWVRLYCARWSPR